MPESPFYRFLEGIPEPLKRDKAFIDELESHSHIVRVKKGEYLLRTGELCTDGYFINKGLFVNLYVDEKGNECVTGFAAECDIPFLSAIGYFTKEASDFEIKAIENGELLCFSRVHIEDLSLRYPLFASYYQNVMLTLISKLYTLFAIRQSCKAEEFIRYMYDNQKWLISRVPDKYIAQYIGITTSWYCKLKKRLFR